MGDLDTDAAAVGLGLCSGTHPCYLLLCFVSLTLP